jgi:hypothetical protein
LLVVTKFEAFSASPRRGPRAKIPFPALKNIKRLAEMTAGLFFFGVHPDGQLIQQKAPR